RSNKPPPEHRFRHDDRQPVEPDAEGVSLRDRGREAVRDDEQIGKNHAHGNSPSANSTRQEPLPEVNHAADPENLARNEDQEQDQEEAQLVRMYDVEGSRSKDQYQNDRAPMSDDAPVDLEKAACLADFGARRPEPQTERHCISSTRRSCAILFLNVRPR